MKVYLFYKLYNGLEPTLYAYTNDKIKAQIFKGTRKNFYAKEKNVSKKEWKSLQSEYGNLALTSHEFVTKADIGIQRVLQVCTERELKTILLDGEKLLIKELNRYSLPIDLFTKNIQDLIERVLNYSKVSNYFEKLMVYPGDSIAEEYPLKKYKLDELGLFLMLYGNMFDEKKDKDRNL